MEEEDKVRKEECRQVDGNPGQSVTDSTLDDVGVLMKLTPFIMGRNTQLTSESEKLKGSRGRWIQHVCRPGCHALRAGLRISNSAHKLPDAPAPTS